ncbi:NADP(H)-dependent aldo-keto reductase [Natronospirillum operosum]|uniref:Protein tas n=1 Tax=Natronospirillum operosum TaxID=2759953 RepID=A0A4Z0WJP4_9GAMM|nr:NADP(H)-dependent aldo-keto reductase [Natronospirillum operosum]TGG95721.1 NADP(H)-dependent aldo-keto reductase [Natronospirillum operosum]
MEYRTLGNTDIRVSKICLGTMTWGEQNTEAEAHQQLDYALDRGVNFIDAAEMYPVPPRAETQGATERYLGSWLHRRGQRDKVVLATKVTGRSDNFPYLRDGPRLNATQLQQALDDSLRRLQTDYVDLYQIHWPERKTNFFGQLGYQHQTDEDAIEIEETLMALDQLVRSGKVRHIGLSNETPWGVHEYLRLSEAGQGQRIVSIQNPYNLLNRTFEVGLAEMAMREQVGLLAYSPLAFGVLSGKYLGGRKPDGARLTLFDRFSRYTSEVAENASRQYVDLARQHGLDPAQMALAFVNDQPFVTTNIIGATSVEQLQDNIGSADLRLSDEVRAEIERIHLSQPNPCP